MNSDNEFRNENEIRIFSLPRSGAHAIMTWFASMFSEPVYLFDNNQIFFDPFRTRFNSADNILALEPDLASIFQSLKNMHSWPENRINRIRNKKKECIMYRYEINHLVNNRFWELKIRAKNHNNSYVGKSKFQFDVIVLRDFKNWLASLIRFQDGTWFMEKNKKRYMELWSHVAEEFIGDTNFLPSKKIQIKYNEWFADDGYRKKIAQLMNLEYSDKFINRLSITGRSKKIPTGSSFDDATFKNKANEMQVLERYKLLQGDDLEFYNSIVEEYSELLELSNEIFGEF